MARQDNAVTWEAEPHTIAKIGILKGYLNAWFAIFGQRPPTPGCALCYVDGFAGPGRYQNASEGSPIAALRAASEALASLKSKDVWKAGDIHFFFIEPDRQAFEHLKSHVEPFRSQPGVTIHLINDLFERGLRTTEASLLEYSPRPVPTMVFADPFGATGVPFREIERLLARPFTEVLVNLDADGIARNWSAGYEGVLDEVFSEPSWREVLDPKQSFRERCLLILGHYKRLLLSVPQVRYAFSFEMLTSHRQVGQVGYFLVFASKHPTGLRKMKEAMKRIDQDGSFSFSNARVGRLPLFREDDPLRFGQVLFERFAGRRQVHWQEVSDFALNESPFLDPKSMLRSLEDQGMIEVVSSDPRRRPKTFNEKNIRFINFKDGG